MHKTHAIVSTQLGSKYLQQLCKHFSHKVTVDYDSEAARVDFPFGLCFMVAGADTLAFYMQSPRPEGLMRAKAVVDDHLLRFGFREELTIEWNEGLPNDMPKGKRPDLDEMF
jgi:hypothetical protein